MYIPYKTGSIHLDPMCDKCREIFQSHSEHMCQGQKSRFNAFFWEWSSHLQSGILIHGHIMPHYWVDDHPLTQEPNKSLEPSTYGE